MSVLRPSNEIRMESTMMKRMENQVRENFFDKMLSSAMDESTRMVAR